MSTIRKIIKFLINSFKKKEQLKSNNVTLEDIIDQLSKPSIKKVLTNDEIKKQYLIQEAMYQLELDMLKMSPVRKYNGTQRWKDKDGNIYFDFVPCSVRPEVVYCNTHRN